MQRRLTTNRHLTPGYVSAVRADLTVDPPPCQPHGRCAQVARCLDGHPCPEGGEPMITVGVAGVEVEVPDDVEVHQTEEGHALRVTLLAPDGRYATMRIDHGYMRAHPVFAGEQVSRMVVDMLRLIGREPVRKEVSTR